jgi:hypothetical protein
MKDAGRLIIGLGDWRVEDDFELYREQELNALVPDGNWIAVEGGGQYKGYAYAEIEGKSIVEQLMVAA